MGTKNRPGKYSCFEKLAQDEPYFVLRGRDPLAADIVERWANMAQEKGVPLEKVVEARRCAFSMRDYQPKKMPD